MASLLPDSIRTFRSILRWAKKSSTASRVPDPGSGRMKGSPVGDCGAFSYRDQEKPPYTPADMVEFYDDCRFTHGCSVDHIIFEFDPKLSDGLKGAYDKNQAEIDETLDAVMTYARILNWDDKVSEETNERRLETLRNDYHRTLTARPWQQCRCPICKEVSVEVIIFRASNRNKRRWIHNMDVFIRLSFTAETRREMVCSMNRLVLQFCNTS